MSDDVPGFNGGPGFLGGTPRNKTRFEIIYQAKIVITFFKNIVTRKVDVNLTT